MTEASAGGVGTADADAHPVPQLTPKLTWWQEAELLWLNRVMGPWRRRRHHDPMPPPLTAEETARRLFALPVSYWTYDFEPGVRHLGPMAQDFAAAFGLGNTNRKINMVDANGVAIITIQALRRKVEALEAEVARLAARLSLLEVSGSGQTAEGSATNVEPPPNSAKGQPR